MDLLMLSDPLENDFGPTRVPLLLSRELSKEHHIVIASPTVSPRIRQEFDCIDFIDLDAKFYFGETTKIWLESCLKETFLNWYSKKLKSICDITQFKIITFTCNFAIPADIAYAMGTFEPTLLGTMSNFPLYYRSFIRLMMPLIWHIDNKISENINSAKIVLANSRFSSSMHEKAGVKVEDIIYPPIDCEKYKPSTSKPSSEYILSYIGKETPLKQIKKIADSGVKIKTFGSKISYLPNFLKNHSNIENLGFIDEGELISLYSNALFTIFPFTNEFFGYIPVESMACGTPVLTYAIEGPSETVIDNVTGWLAHDNNELAHIAIQIYREGYSSIVRGECRNRSLIFDVKRIAEEWRNYL